MSDIQLNASSLVDTCTSRRLDDFAWRIQVSTLLGKQQQGSLPDGPARFEIAAESTGEAVATAERARTAKVAKNFMMTYWRGKFGKVVEETQRKSAIYMLLASLQAVKRHALLTCGRSDQASDVANFSSLRDFVLERRVVAACFRGSEEQ